MTSKSRKSAEPSTAPMKRATPVAAKSTPRTKDLEPATASSTATKQDHCLQLLARRDGATLAELVAATDWQPHSVRGFLSGTVKKKLGLTLVSSKADGYVRRYRVVEAGARGR